MEDEAIVHVVAKALNVTATMAGLATDANVQPAQTSASMKPEVFARVKANASVMIARAWLAAANSMNKFGGFQRNQNVVNWRLNAT